MGGVIRIDGHGSVDVPGYPDHVVYGYSKGGNVVALGADDELSAWAAWETMEQDTVVWLNWANFIVERLRGPDAMKEIQVLQEPGLWRLGENALKPQKFQPV